MPNADHSPGFCGDDDGVCDKNSGSGVRVLERRSDGSCGHLLDM